VLYKKDIVNFLFVISFPIYGFGSYISASKSPTAGFMVSISPHLLIILFYAIDMLYKKEFQIRANRYYLLAWLYLITCIVSLFRALSNRLPEDNLMITVAKCVLLVTPLNAFIVVALYNNDGENRLPKLTFISLSVLLLINLMGFYGLGLSNEVHSIEGRVNFPFLDGFYSGACVLAILNLMIIYYMSRSLDDPFRLAYLAAYFTFNLALLFMINSRISILIFLFVALLLSFKVIEKTRGLFVSSLFTVPVLLNSGLILYQILTLPFFVSILKRVDIEDVTTFNGRAFIWRNAMNWLTDDQRGIFLGNGYKGHYFLDLISDVAKLWNSDVRDYHHMHLHSSSFEILVCQGIAGFAIFMILFYRLYVYYRKKYRDGDEQGIFFAVGVFLLFIMQVDTFVYLESSGAVIFSLLLANVVITHPPRERDSRAENRYPDTPPYGQFAQHE
jgi:hypothetical protein